jgi:hypothetical protein
LQEAHNETNKVYALLQQQKLGMAPLTARSLNLFARYISTALNTQRKHQRSQRVRLAIETKTLKKKIEKTTKT